MTHGAYQELAFHVEGRARRAALWLPPGFDPGRRWPVVVYLHGYGERGDGMEHVQHGLGPVLDRAPERFPCLVLMPQCPTDLVWSLVDQPWAVGHGGAEAHIDAAIGALLTRYPVASERIALTGLSMGGFGTLVYGAARAARFCAFVAICGGGHVSDAPRFVGRPLWLLHGAADEVVSVDESRDMVRAIRAAGAGDELRYTEYPGVGHNSWDLAYADPEVAGFLVRRRG